MRVLISAAAAVLLASASALACGKERWPVKIAADQDVGLVAPTAALATIATLTGVPVPPNPNIRQNTRFAPAERTPVTISGIFQSGDGSGSLGLERELHARPDGTGHRDSRQIEFRVPISVANAITYQPFGPVSGLTYGNGIAETRSFDLDYRLTRLIAAGNSQLQDMT